MRRLKEINKDIEVINRQMNALKEKIEELYYEKRERIFADFCEKHGVKGGDIVEINDKEHTRLQVIGLSSQWSGWVLCRKIKKNGEPYLNTTTYLPEHFDGCKVIKSNEDLLLCQ